MAGKKAAGRRYFYLKSSDQITEYLKCQNDPVYFIMTYVMIPHPIRGKVPFKLFQFQKALIGKWLEQRWTVILKPRQMGVSTLVCGYALWVALFHPYKFITMISIKESVAKAMLRKVKLMFQNLPDFLRMEVANGSGDSIGTADRLAWVNGSEITASSATENAGRSEALSLLIMDEVAFQMYASGIWASAQPTLSTGGRAILLSSAFGVGNFFHETYNKAVIKANTFYPIRLQWQMHPERDIKWYNEQLGALGTKRVAQEIDCDFLQSGYNVFDMAKIKAIEDRLLERRPIREEEGGRFKMYFDYDRTKRYYIGADVASGRARDYSTFSVFDHTGKEVACYKGQLGVAPFAHLLMKWGKYYGTALLAPESNGIGEGVISICQINNYPNIYNMVSNTLKIGDYDYTESSTYGWLTTGKSRNKIITGMDDDLNDDLVELYNPFFVNEAYTFVYSGVSNKPVALGKQSGKGSSGSMYEDEGSGTIYTDDSILGACIGNEARKVPFKYSGDGIMFGSGA